VLGHLGGWHSLPYLVYSSCLFFSSNHILLILHLGTWVQFLYSKCSSGFFAICEVLHIKGLTQLLAFLCSKILSSFCNASTLLCPLAKLFTTYYVSITMYLAMLYQVWCLYHSYVKKTIRVKIFWYRSGPFDSSSNHFSCFFKGAKDSFSHLTCCLCLFRMLGFDCSCISFSFLVGWSFYFSWCGGTCKDWYLSFLGRITRYMCDVTWGHLITCLVFQKSNYIIPIFKCILFWKTNYMSRNLLYF